MKTKRNCPNCQTSILKQIAEGINDHKWYSYYECDNCKNIQTTQINRPAKIHTEYSVSSTELLTIGINEKDWPNP